MHLATIDLNGPMGNLILAVYVIGGITLFAVSLLPGKSALWRIAGAVIGLGIALWSGYVFLFGGWIIINFYVALLPFILAGKSVYEYFQNRKATQESEAPQAQGFQPQPGQPHPGQPYAQPGPAQPGQPHAFQPQPGQPQPGQPYAQPQHGQPYPQQQPGSYTPQG